MTPLFYLRNMEKKRRPFTEKEDEIITLCLAEATSPNISHVIRKVSALTGRSFSSCYNQYNKRIRKPTTTPPMTPIREIFFKRDMLSVKKFNEWMDNNKERLLKTEKTTKL